MKITLKNDAGVVKRRKVGFSWTTFFFGFLPALFRGDLKWAAIMFISEAVVGGITFFMLGLGATIVGIIFSFKYNQIHIKELLEKGYYPVDEDGKQELQQRQIIA